MQKPLTVLLVITLSVTLISCRSLQSHPVNLEKACPETYRPVGQYNESDVLILLGDLTAENQCLRAVLE